MNNITVQHIAQSCGQAWERFKHFWYDLYMALLRWCQRRRRQRRRQERTQRQHQRNIEIATLSRKISKVMTRYGATLHERNATHIANELLNDVDVLDEAELKKVPSTRATRRRANTTVTRSNAQHHYQQHRPPSVSLRASNHSPSSTVHNVTPITSSHTTTSFNLPQQQRLRSMSEPAVLKGDTHTPLDPPPGTPELALSPTPPTPPVQDFTIVTHSTAEQNDNKVEDEFIVVD